MSARYKMKNKDHSHDNENLNSLECINDAQNLNDVEQIFGDGLIPR